MSKLFIKSLIIINLFYFGCGDPIVDINNVEYNPKIAVEAYLYPGKDISDVKIMRNFPINKKINESEIYLNPTDNFVNAKINGNALLFDNVSKTYYYNTIDLKYGETYNIEIEATFDGQKFRTNSSTTIPDSGFKILNNNLGTIKYNTENIIIKFNPSPSSDFYLFSIIADSASPDNFIYDNPFLPNLTREDIEKNFNSFLYQYRYLQNILPDPTKTYELKIEVYDAWFYSPYRVIVYACDKNFKDYFLSNQFLQQFDGNFNEPKKIMQGDGIGIFGSAIIDTVRFILIP
ncbi:MAG: DUF4249 family protein [Ignavibacteriales bacterium]|nr:DUF4249 family protein [Ignavibacteriales bacterium]